MSTPLKPETIEEEWRPVWFCPRYEVSNLGGLRRYRADGSLKALYPGPDSRGYIYATLSLGDGAVRRCTLHSLVAEAFLGTRPLGFTVNHKDGVKANNVATNLEWITIGDNLRHAIRLGLRVVHGERNGRSKLSDQQVLLVQQFVGLSEWSQEEIARAFGIGQSHVSRIHLGLSRCGGANSAQ